MAGSQVLETECNLTKAKQSGYTCSWEPLVPPISEMGPGKSGVQELGKPDSDAAQKLQSLRVAKPLPAARWQSASACTLLS